MKISKPQSLTTDTRLSQSHFFNNSLLNKTNLTTTSQKHNNNIVNAFQQYQSKQIDFIKIKNSQLQDKVKRMSEQIKQLQQNKVYLLKLNEKYVNVVNQYYRDLHHDYQHNQTVTQSSSVNKIKEVSKEGYFNAYNQAKKQKQFTEKQKLQVKRQKSLPKNKYNSQSFQNLLAEQVLTELEKDHRNLVKHCLVMQNQIKNYIVEMDKFNVMKAQLLSVNHTTPKQLIIQLEQTTRQNKQLKKQNNRLGFELQKSKSQCSKLKKAKQNQNKQLSSNGQQTQKLRSQINKIVQQSTDKSNDYEQRIYDLELKVQKLEKQLRGNQQFVFKNQQKRKNLQIQRVQNVHENSFLKANLTQILDPKKHPLLSLDRSFVYKKNKDKSISLNKTFINLK